jgi:hypothetical protein
LNRCLLGLVDPTNIDDKNIVNVHEHVVVPAEGEALAASVLERRVELYSERVVVRIS